MNLFDYTYHALKTVGDDTIRTRHDLLMYAESNVRQYQHDMGNQLLLSQIKSIQTPQETNELSHYAINAFIHSNNTDVIITHLPDIFYQANSNSTMA
ncbi:MAG: hypothetical protein Q4G13_07910, partial [Moraxella sp.]|nr:hypothetical protein [Moraxella sp.]